jgi:hypothetical protein
MQHFLERTPAQRTEPAFRPAERFQDLHWQNEFDGIWICASLLHVPKTFFTCVATRLAVALRPGAVWYMSFKIGIGERVAGGRLSVDHDEEMLRVSLAAAPIDIIDTWLSTDIRPGRSNEQWLNLVARKASLR